MASERGNKIMRNNSNQWNNNPHRQHNIDPSEYDEQEADRILAEELLQLSFDERNKIHEEIHGVRNAFLDSDEDSESMERYLYEMDGEVETTILEKIHRGLRLEHIPTNRKLRLTFLRCELYDVKKAAHRLVTYIRTAREQCSCGGGVAGCACGSVGDGETGGRIQASKWFTKEEHSTLKKGIIQLMPYRDRSGRRVLIPMAASFRLCTITRLKIVLYLITEASDDVESQKRGLVILIWPGMCESIPPSKSGITNDRLLRIGNDFEMAIPLRVVSIQFGYESSKLLKFARILLVAIMQKGNRVRFNIIDGTQTEINYKIMSYGIHPAMLPITDNGIIKTRNHVKWLETRECMEREPYGSLKATASGGAIVDCPGVNDVLFNRGKSCQYHPGNITFRGMLESKKHLHLTANQTMKREIAWEIMSEVESKNGRFLYCDNSGWWMEFENRIDIRHKVATSLRDFNKQTRASQKRQDTNCSTNVFRDQEQRKRKRDQPGNDDSSTDCSCLGGLMI